MAASGKKPRMLPKRAAVQIDTSYNRLVNRLMPDFFGHGKRFNRTLLALNNNRTGGLQGAGVSPALFLALVCRL
jgi:hypothetical protein